MDSRGAQEQHSTAPAIIPPARATTSEKAPTLTTLVKPPLTLDDYEAPASAPPTQPPASFMPPMAAKSSKIAEHYKVPANLPHTQASASVTPPMPARAGFTSEHHKASTDAPPTGPAAFVMPSIAANPGLVLDSVVHLVIGGEGRVQTTVSTLVGKSTYFRRYLVSRSLPKASDGMLICFVDANPRVFEHILEYLRRGTFPLLLTSSNDFDYPMYARLHDNAVFFGIDTLAWWIDKKMYRIAMAVCHA